MPKTVSVRISHTVNMGNYESVKPELELTDELVPNEDFAEAYARIYVECSSLYEKLLTSEILKANARNGK